MTRELIDRGTPLELQQMIQRVFEVQNSGCEKGYKDAKRLKTIMDAAYLQHDYGAFESLRIKVGGPLEIAATGAITPNRSSSLRIARTHTSQNHGGKNAATTSKPS